MPATFFLIFCTAISIISAAPTNSTANNEVDCDDADDGLLPVVYDQRQNGSENVRVNVKDVFLVWAPEEQTGGDSDFLDYPNEEVPQKPLGEKPTSIIDILNSFQELSAGSPSPIGISTFFCVNKTPFEN